MTELNSKPDHGIRLVDKDGKADTRLQLFFDDIDQRLNDRLLGSSVRLESYLVAGLPAQFAGGMIFVTNETGGAVPAFSDGINWRRVTDRVIVS